MARQLDMKIGIADSDTPAALSGPVSGVIGGVPITIGPRGSSLELTGFGPGAAVDAGYYQIDLQDETTLASYTEQAYSFGGTAAPKYMQNVGGNLTDATVFEEVGFFFSGIVRDTVLQRTLQTGTSGGGAVAPFGITAGRMDVNLFIVNSSDVYQNNLLSSSAPLLTLRGGDGSPRRVEILASVKGDGTNWNTRIYSRFGSETAWTLDVNTTTAQSGNKIRLRQGVAGANLGFCIGGDNTGTPTGNPLHADVYRLAMMASPTRGSLPDLTSATDRDKFFNLSTLKTVDPATTRSEFDSEFIIDLYGTQFTSADMNGNSAAGAPDTTNNAFPVLV